MSRKRSEPPSRVQPIPTSSRAATRLDPALHLLPTPITSPLSRREISIHLRPAENSASYLRICPVQPDSDLLRHHEHNPSSARHDPDRTNPSSPTTPPLPPPDLAGQCHPYLTGRPLPHPSTRSPIADWIRRLLSSFPPLSPSARRSNLVPPIFGLTTAMSDLGRLLLSPEPATSRPATSLLHCSTSASPFPFLSPTA